MSVLSVVLYLLMHLSDVEGILDKFMALIHGISGDRKQEVLSETTQAMHKGPKAVEQTINHLCNGAGIGCDGFKGTP